MPEAKIVATTRPEASVRVTVALLAVRESRLTIATMVDGETRLPTCVPKPRASLDDVARDLMVDITGSPDGYLEQLYTFTFDADRTNEIVVSYLGLAPNGAELRPGCTWRPADETLDVPASDRVVVDYALVRLQAKIGYTTIAFHLMPASFSLSDLQQTYESILSRPLDPRNFRRRMVTSGLLQPENRLRREGSHRPAALYRFAGNHDPGSFLTPSANRSDDKRA